MVVLGLIRCLMARGMTPKSGGTGDDLLNAIPPVIGR